MNAHTPEPWKLWRDMDPSAPIGIQGQSGDLVCEMARWAAEANSARIVACINACAGMDDPAAEIARLRECEAALRGVVAAWARGDEPGDFGEHPAARSARSALI